jgi:hypothetical protein
VPPSERVDIPPLREEGAGSARNGFSIQQTTELQMTKRRRPARTDGHPS